MNRQLARRARGLTLIELVIVLLVLVALAGILVPNFTGIPARAHGSSGADNIKEIYKALNYHEATTGLGASGFDSLYNGTAPYTGIPNTTGIGSAPHALSATQTLTTLATTLTGTPTAADVVAALSEAGITTLSPMSATPTDATFTANSGAPTAVAAGTNVLTLSTSGISALGLTTETYLVFGFGAQVNMIGKTIADAPVHFPEGATTLATQYSRWYLAYQVTSGGTLRAKARLASVFALEPTGEASGLQGHLAEYYEAAQ